MTPKSSQANWHLIHHHHITKLFHLLNQNTMFITDNTHFQNIHSFHHQKSIHTSFIIFSIPNNTITHTKSILPLISNHIILKQSTIKGNKLRQHSLVNTVVFAFWGVFLVVQSTVRYFPHVTIIPQKNTTRFATELQDRGIFNLESEYHSQHELPRLRKCRLLKLKQKTEIHLNSSTVNRATKPAYLPLVAPR